MAVPLGPEFWINLHTPVKLKTPSCVNIPPALFPELLTNSAMPFHCRVVCWIQTAPVALGPVLFAKVHCPKIVTGLEYLHCSNCRIEATRDLSCQQRDFLQIFSSRFHLQKCHF